MHGRRVAAMLFEAERTEDVDTVVLERVAIVA